ncbi:hypothetical protein Dimus_039085 [Dionaea muscipula]
MVHYKEKAKRQETNYREIEKKRGTNKVQETAKCRSLQEELLINRNPKLTTKSKEVASGANGGEKRPRNNENSRKLPSSTRQPKTRNSRD